MIRLFLRAGQPGTRKAILDAIPSPLHTGIDEIFCSRGRNIPKKAAFILHTTKAKPSQPAEWFAASRGTYIVCIPEAVSWFQEKLSDHLAANADTVIFDAGLHRILRLV